MPGGPAVLRFTKGLPPTKQFGERLRLLVLQGQDKGTCYSLLGDVVFIGREDCQIVLNDTNISRKHAEVGWKGDHYMIRDLGSSNGILCNGQKVNEAKLTPGDILLMGLTVVEVYPPGQTRKNDKPLLPAPVRRTGVSAVPPPAANPEPVKLSAKEEREQKQAVARKRMIITVVVFFLLSAAYFSDQQETMRQHSTIPRGDEDEDTAKPKKKLKKDELKQLIAEYTPNYSLDTQQRKDAEVFFRNGVRELQNKNFRRAFTAFDTALTVDPSHELAKIYLKSAKMEMINELKSTEAAALRSMKSLRYKEARMHYENIVRYLDGETGNNQNLDKDSIDKVTELSAKAKEALKELDKIENKGGGEPAKEAAK